MPPTIEQQVTFLYTPDLAKTAEFYEQVIGLSLALDQGKCRIYHVAAGAFVGFCERADAAPAAADIIFTLVTPEVDAWHTHLTAHNIPIDKPPTYYPDYNIYHLFARDPNGYRIEIQQFKDPAWPRPGAANH